MGYLLGVKYQKPQALNMLYSYIVKPNEFSTHDKKYKGEIHGSSFEIWVKRSLLWGSLFRTQIKGHGTLSEHNEATKLSATFEICFPFNHANLTNKTAAILACIAVISWIGIIATMISGISNSILAILFPAAFISVAILLAWFERQNVIDDKFKLLKRDFSDYFENTIKARNC